jgi:hypothetical protein
MKISNLQNQSPKTLGRLALCLLILGFSFSERSSAATVTYVGSETGSAGNGYSVQNWSNAGVTKVYDIGGSEVYGSSGYVQIRPGPTDLYQGIADNNNLGVGAATNPTLLSRPSFISSVTGGAGDFVNFGGYSTYRGPDGSAIYRQGALAVAVNNGPYSPELPVSRELIPSSYFGIAMHFTVNAGSYFRVGLAVDSLGSGTYAPDYVGLYSNSTGTKISSLLNRDGSADMVFFNVDTRGDAASTTFDVSLWQKSGTQGSAGLSLVTFDAIPEPSTALLALVGMGCLAIHSRRRR